VQPTEESLDAESPIAGTPDDLQTFAADEPANAEAYIDKMIRLLRQDGVRFPKLSIGGSSDPAIVGKVIRSELRQTIARNCDGQFSLDQQVQAIASPFSPRLGRSLAR
jgi:hypothetical protein